MRHPARGPGGQPGIDGKPNRRGRPTTGRSELHGRFGGRGDERALRRPSARQDAPT